MLIRSDNMSVVSYINHQGGVSSKRLFILAERLLEWAQLNLRSLRAAHLPGRLNQGADMLSRSNVPSEEWMLHPQVVQKIWKTFGKAEVGRPFRLQRQLSLPNLLFKGQGLAHDWPNLLLYAFPPIALLPQVVRRIREQGHKVLQGDGISSLRRTEQYGTLDPSCGLSTFGRSMGAYWPPRASVKHHF